MPDLRAALARGAIASPDLAIVDAQLPDGAGISLLGPLRERLGQKKFPIIVLADGSLSPAAVYGGESSATDYMAKPISPPMLRARVRAWLARTTASRRESVAIAGGPPEPEAAAPEPSPQAADFANLLGSLPLFRTLPLEQRLRMVERATEQRFSPGHAIVQQGEWPDRLFVILSGKVRVVESASETQTEWMLGELTEGELFGELALLTDRPRSATVVATEPTRCLVLPQRDFMHVLHSAPGLGIGMVRMLAARLYDADRKLARYAPDPVTGLASRRAFHDQYPRVAATARRRKSGLLLLMLDVVQLKTINDRFGYSLGDDVLRAVADALMESTRTTDLAARYGADEFAVLLPEAQPKDVQVVVNRVREKLAELSTRRGLPRVVYCSVGIAHRPIPPDTPDELFREADVDMQRSRGGGR
jgi:diguanylate cyclase (GGDEF)-like protein